MMTSHNRRILVIDDNPAIHDDIRKVLVPRPLTSGGLEDATAMLFGEPQEEKGPTFPDFDLTSAMQGREGVAKAETAVNTGQPFALAIVDVRMPPGQDGVQTTRELFAIDPHLQVVLCTAYSDYRTDDLLETFGYCERLQLLKKPFDVTELTLLAISLTEKWHQTQIASRTIRRKTQEVGETQKLLRLVEIANSRLEEENHSLANTSERLGADLLKQLDALIETQNIATIALAQLAESRDPETGAHLLRMRTYADRLAEWLSERTHHRSLVDENYRKTLHRSTPLHDIGKVGIPDAVLLKPGRLTEDEYEVMKTHTLIGAEALRQAREKSAYGDFLDMAIEIARSHHERWDGAGYPDGLRGDEIPLSARITAVADVFDALSSQRVYKPAFEMDRVYQIITEGRETQFDPLVVDAFEACFEQFLKDKQRIEAKHQDALAADSKAAELLVH